MSGISRNHSVRRPAGAARLAILSAGLFGLAGAMPASAQDLTFHFVDPSFGGNPFYSDHLLATAAIGRPAAPTTPSTAQTQEELIAAQLRAQLLSTLSGNILDAINNAKVGDTNTYTFGNQTVSYKKTSTETDVTFTNTDTGAVNTVVIPSSSSTSSTAAAAVEAARVNAAATSSNVALTGSLTGVSSGITASGSGSANAGRSAEQVLSASQTAAGTGSVLPPL